jgi:hypothetical protein
MPFEKGMEKTGGRKPGVRNRATVEIREFARWVLEDPVYHEKLKERIIAGTAPRVEELFFHYLFGKPKSELELSRKTVVVSVKR